ncbi:MAG TPA: hypothetical protein VGJ14_15210 [Sporichthyaceae bacterium]
MSDAEVARPYPCDAFASGPAPAAWRGVTVRAPAAAVWPWVRQIRLAPYSYDWIDNLGRRSPRELRDLPDPVPGDRLTASAGRPIGRVLAVEPGVHLTGRIMGALMSWVLVPVRDDASRLLLKVVLPPRRVQAQLIAAGDLVMSRRQLLNLARLAEGRPGPSPTPQSK